MTGLYNVDHNSLDIAPSDVPGVVKIPISVSAAGNCLSRSGSIFAFGHDNWHREIRARIVMELVINEGLYIDNEYLRRGTDIKCNVKENFAQYSEIFTPGIILTDHIIASIFEE